MKKFYPLALLFASFFIVFTLPAQTFRLLKDINQQTNSNPSNNVNNTDVYALLNGKAYFAADDGIHGKELWSSDGTNAGTKMVKDIYAGSMGSGISSIFTYKNNIYFFANDATNSLHLWQSDGSAAGTKILIDSLPKSLVPSATPPNFAIANNKLFFTVTNAYDNEELWCTDGTKAGSAPLVNLNPGGYNAAKIGDFTVFKNRLFFTGNYGSQLWVSNGTIAGTYKFNVKGSVAYQPYNDLTVAGDTLYFAHNSFIWQTTGDSTSTKIVPANISAFRLTSFANQLYAFSVQNPGIVTLQKYTSNGTGYSFTMVKKLSATLNAYNCNFLYNYKDSLLYLTTPDSSNKPILWVTNGTDNGTIALVKEHGTLHSFATHGNKVLFSYDGNDKSDELWQTNGTINGTQMLKDINPGVHGSSIASATSLGNNILFTANEVSTGFELWKTDGTTAGTALVKDINVTATAGSDALITRGFADTINNHLIFIADDGINESQIWSTDGTTAGTFLTKALYLGRNYGLSRLPNTKINTRFKGYNYFYSVSPVNNFQLWKTGGLPNSTSLVSNVFTSAEGIVPVSSGSTPNYFFSIILPHGNGINLNNLDSTGGRLFAYNGSGEPVTIKKGFYPDITGTDGHNMLNLGNTIYFSIVPQDGTKGLELWKSDGTAGGTALVKNLYPGRYLDAFVSDMIQFKNQLFITARAGFSPSAGDGFVNDQHYLWKTDGTAAGTIVLTRATITGKPAVIAGEKLFFVATTDTTGEELWVTDGTEAGTHLVKDIVAGPGSSSITGIAALNNYLYFTADSGKGPCLWKTDGTEKGTTVVSNHGGIFAVASKNRIYITDGTAMWQSDGTAEGTHEISLTGISGAYNLRNLYYYNDRLYFTADSYEYGTELYTSEYLLPVTLLDFTAQLHNNDALLQWSTVNEQNNSYFNVQRSTSGTSFTTIARVDAKNGVKKNDYDYTDAGVTALGADKLYYRLQQFDADGKFTYSKTIPLTINSKTLVTIGPNPAIDVANIYSSVNMPGAVVTITDMGGRVLYTAKQNIVAGSKTSIPLQGFAKGVYTVTIQGSDTPKQEFKLVAGK